MDRGTAVKLSNISKFYKLYEKPIDRLKESIHPFKKKYHKSFFALRDINLEIKKGEVLGIVGVNGAGKSTLLKILAGVMSASTGRVEVQGKINAILELGSSLKNEMTGRENVRLNLQINGIENKSEEITNDIIAFADIGEHIDQPVKTYSSGMKARLGFGIATSTNPDILIIDEVLAVGDVLFKRKCYGRIEKFFKEGKTVIFVSHNAQSVIEFCSRAILLYDRRIVMDDTPKKVTDYYQRLVFSGDSEKGVTENITDLDDVKKTNVTVDLVEKKEQVKINDEYYLPGLKSAPVESKNYDVDIFDAMILDSTLKKVNVLQTGGEYTFTYKVKFFGEHNNVGFGTQLKTMQGFVLTHVKVEANKHLLIKNVKSSSEYVFSIVFTCGLLEGVYLFNAGVSVVNDNEPFYYLNRIVDIVAFKVSSDPEICVGGVLEQNYKLSIDSNDMEMLP